MAPVSSHPSRAPLRIALATFLMLFSTLIGAVGPVAAANPFVDVRPDHPAYTAIDQLFARGVINGYQTTPRTFGPDDKSLRAQMAALIGRAMAFGTGGTNPFQDRCNASGCIDEELWGFIAALASRDVAKGYDPATYGPFDNVLKQQVILFIARAKVSKGEWVKQPDNPRIYPRSAGSVSDHQDIVTYVFYAGAPPDAPRFFDAPWGEYSQEATRGWFARALWQAYAEGKGPALAEPTPEQNPDPSPNTAAFAAKVLELTNAERQKNGCAVMLTDQFQLKNAAQKHAQDMAVQDYFSHTGKNGSSFGQRVADEGYNMGQGGENIGAGYASPEAAVQGWMQSPGHRANILNCNYTQLGVGYFYLANDTGAVNYNHYWVQVFGTPQ